MATYRTMQGKELDMGELILRNENSRAVGNMNVDAVGRDMTKAKKKANKSNAHRKTIGNKPIDPPTNSKPKVQKKKVTAKKEAVVKTVKKEENVNNNAKKVPSKKSNADK